MTLMAAAAGADDLGANHAVAGVADFAQMAVGEGRGEARPAGPAVELGAALEQRQPAQPTGVEARPLLGQEHPAERRLGAMTEQHAPRVVIELACERAELVVRGRSKIELEYCSIGHG